MIARLGRRPVLVHAALREAMLLRREALASPREWLPVITAVVFVEPRLRTFFLLTNAGLGSNVLPWHGVRFLLVLRQQGCAAP